MDIISPVFLLSSLIAVGFYYLLNPRYRNLFLVLLSSAFVLSLNYALLPYVLIYALFNFYIGLKLESAKNKIILYRIGLIVNLTQLIILKYASFTIDPLFSLFNLGIHVSKLSEYLVPIGISYFTLQGIGYLINIKMNWEKPEKNLVDFLLYIVFFPKFLAGPIERSNHFIPQLKKPVIFDQDMVTRGLRQVLIGVFKKVAIANQLAPYVFHTFQDLSSVEGLNILVIFVLLPLYLYFDFSGYTDIAVGLARAFGIELFPNFNRPFFSENVTAFWKRFHITLGAWFEYYVFRQVVFKRRRWGVYASMYAVFITWMLFGIWHGGGWNFVFLGILQSVAINYEHFTKKSRAKFFSWFPKPLHLWTGRLFTYLFYCVSLVFFFSPDLSTAFHFFSKFSGIHGHLNLDGISTTPFMLFIYIPLFFIHDLIQNDFPVFFTKAEKFWLGDRTGSRIFRWTIYSLIITIVFVEGFKAQQFVYANF